MSRAIQEFNKTSPKNDNESTPSIQRKGANLPKKRSVLGRGLSALMSPTTTIDLNNASNTNLQVPLPPKPINLSNEQTLETKPLEQNDQKASTENQLNEDQVASSPKASTQNIPFLNIAIDQLVPNPKQPRTTFNQKEIRELASSIRRSGVLQPLLVRKKSGSSSAFASYEIVAGERRWRAAKEAGLITVPAVVKELDDQETLEIGIIENIQRQDLNPIEEALAYSRLMAEFGSTQEQLSQVFGKDRSSIANTMRLLNLPEEIQELLRERKLSAGHARTLLGVEDKEEQISLAKTLAEEKLSVRQAEKLAAERKDKTTPNKKIESSNQTQSIQDAALEDRLRRALGTKVKVQMSASGKGEVKISFFSRSEFENFLEKVGA